MPDYMYELPGVEKTERGNGQPNVCRFARIGFLVVRGVPHFAKNETESQYRTQLL